MGQTLKQVVVAAMMGLSTSALAAEPSRVVGFVTVDGRHPEPSCVDGGEGEVARLSFVEVGGQKKAVEVSVSCASAPAVAFATELPVGRYRVTVAPSPGRLEQLRDFTALVVVKPSRTMVTLKAPRAAIARRGAASAPLAQR